MIIALPYPSCKYLFPECHLCTQAILTHKLCNSAKRSLVHIPINPRRRRLYDLSRHPHILGNLWYLTLRIFCEYTNKLINT